MKKHDFFNMQTKAPLNDEYVELSKDKIPNQPDIFRRHTLSVAE